MSGQVFSVSKESVIVKKDSVFYKYFHIVPKVKKNEKVTAGITILGEIAPGKFPHIHFEENNGARNPLRKGGLTPYKDNRSPVIGKISFYSDITMNEDHNTLIGETMPVPNQSPLPVLSGIVDILAKIEDRQSNGSQNTAPYRVSYQIRLDTLANVGEREYAANNTFQLDSIPTCGPRWLYNELKSTKSSFYYWVTNSLCSDTVLDTKTLKNGPYMITIFAADIQGNRILENVFVTIKN